MIKKFITFKKTHLSNNLANLRTLLNPYQILACGLAFSVIFSNSVAVSASFESDYAKKKKEISAQISTVQGELDATNIDFHSIQDRKKTLQEELTFLKSEIVKTQNLIKQTENSIVKVNDQIVENTKQIEDLQTKKKEIIQQIQKKDKVSLLQIVLTSQSLSTAITEIYNLSSLQARLDELQDKINSATEELNRNQEALKTTKDNLEQASGLVKIRQGEIQTLLDQTQNDEAKYQELIAGLAAKQKDLNREKVTIDADYAASLADSQPNYGAGGSTNPGSGNSGGGSNSGGSYNAPSPGAGGCGRIREMGGTFNANSSNFVRPTTGNRSQGFTCTHDALDIANGNGTPIYSIADGVIIASGFQGGGYGNYYMIKHTFNGNTIYSVYAHMSATLGKGKGASVSKGEQIGRMGATGLAFGTHLHFAIIGWYSGAIGCDTLYGGTSQCYNPAKAPFNF